MPNTDDIVYCELPLLKRCCFCLPLRPGLLVWEYLKLLTLGVLISLLWIYVIPKINTLDTVEAAFVILAAFLLTLDLLLTVTFLTSLHTKTVRVMKLNLGYKLFIFVTSTIVFIMVLGYLLITMYKSNSRSEYIMPALLCFSFGFMNAVLQFYFLHLTRYFLMKIARNYEESSVLDENCPQTQLYEYSDSKGDYTLA